MIFAPRNYSPGELVAPAARPLVHALDIKHKKKFCDRCVRPYRILTAGPGPGAGGGGTAAAAADHNQLWRCSQCRRMFYCSPECQKQDWDAGHRYECKIFKMDFDTSLTDGTGGDWFNPDDENHTMIDRMILRLWLLRKIKSPVLEVGVELPDSGGSRQQRAQQRQSRPQQQQQQQQQSQRRRRTFADLEDRLKDFTQRSGGMLGFMEKEFRLLMKFAKYGLLNMVTGDLTDAMALLQVWGKVVTNGIMIFVDEDEIKQDQLALTLPLSNSAYRHSCRPNVHSLTAWCSGGGETSGGSGSGATARPHTTRLEKEIVALTAIKAGDELCLSYINTFAPTKVRQSALERYYFFSCTCPRCTAVSRSPRLTAQEQLFYSQYSRGVGVELKQTFERAEETAESEAEVLRAAARILIREYNTSLCNLLPAHCYDAKRCDHLNKLVQVFDRLASVEREATATSGSAVVGGGSGKTDGLSRDEEWEWIVLAKEFHAIIFGIYSPQYGQLLADIDCYLSNISTGKKKKKNKKKKKKDKNQGGGN